MIGRHNENSYVIRVNGSEVVTVRNRCSLRRIPKPAKITLPVSLPGEVRLPGDSEVVTPVSPGHQVSPANGGVIESRGHGGNFVRQNNQGTDNVSQPGNFQNTGITQHGKGPSGIPMSAEETCGKLLRRVADWDVPGNILFEAFHKPKSKATDSADPARRKPGSPPGPPAPQPPSP